MKILLIEDNLDICEALKFSLEENNYDVYLASSISMAKTILNEMNPSLIILDITLPDGNGFDLYQNTIKVKNIPTCILTAKADEESIVKGLELGADDYITKPFHIEEVIARVNIQLKKNSTGKIKDYVEFSDIKLDLKKMILECTTNNETIELGNKEFQLLEYFIKNPNLVLSKEQIYDRVWGIDRETESNNLEAYLSFIRKKLKVIGANTTIKSLRGLGYRLENKDEEIKK